MPNAISIDQFAFSNTGFDLFFIYLTNACNVHTGNELHKNIPHKSIS